MFIIIAGWKFEVRQVSHSSRDWDVEAKGRQRSKEAERYGSKPTPSHAIADCATAASPSPVLGDDFDWAYYASLNTANDSGTMGSTSAPSTSFGPESYMLTDALLPPTFPEPSSVSTLASGISSTQPDPSGLQWSALSSTLNTLTPTSQVSPPKRTGFSRALEACYNLWKY